jgi:flagellar biosynthesis protein
MWTVYGEEEKMKKENKSKAVALQYDQDKDNAPRVVASGVGKVAERIIEAAHAAQVPVKEDSLLAETLSVVEMGHEIPVELFVAVARVLAEIISVDAAAQVK